MEKIKNNFTEEKHTIIESCSAPGNKTLQLQKYFPKNLVMSYEFNKERAEILQKRVNFHRKTSYSDYLLVNDNYFNSKNLENKDKVKIVVCDPSCSGSGMLSNFDQRENIESLPKSINFFF